MRRVFLAVLATLTALTAVEPVSPAAAAGAPDRYCLRGPQWQQICGFHRRLRQRRYITIGPAPILASTPAACGMT